MSRSQKTKTEELSLIGEGEGEIANKCHVGYWIGSSNRKKIVSGKTDEIPIKSIV